jgi:hypothetical protein
MTAREVDYHYCILVEEGSSSPSLWRQLKLRAGPAIGRHSKKISW